MNPIMVVTDLDDTLLDSNRRIDIKGQLKLNELIQNSNIYFTIATARDLTDYRKLELNLNINIPVVLCNGRLIYDLLSNHVVHSYLFDTAIVDSLLEQMHILGLNISIVGIKGDKILRETIDTQNNPIIHNSIIALSTIVGKDNVNLVYSRLSEMYKEILSINIYDYPYSHNRKILDIQPKYYNKGLALSYLRTVISPSCQVVCFGNGTDDISMFQYSDYKVSVGDCPADLTKIADKNIVYKENSVIDEIELYVNKYVNRR